MKLTYPQRDRRTCVRRTLANDYVFFKLTHIDNEYYRGYPLMSVPFTMWTMISITEFIP